METERKIIRRMIKERVGTNIPEQALARLEEIFKQSLCGMSVEEFLVKDKLTKEAIWQVVENQLKQVMNE
jgi:purine nucleoside phosphorylase